MERKILVLLVGLILTGIVQIRAQDLVSKEEVIRILKEKILKEDTLNRDKLVYISRKPLLGDSFIMTNRYIYQNPYPECWFFFIDDVPAENFGHPCRYVFLRSENYYMVNPRNNISSS